MFTLEQLGEKSKHRPQGYYDDVLAAAIIQPNGMYILPDEKAEELKLKYRLPSLIKMAGNLSTAVVEIAKDPTRRSEEEIKRIMAICATCEFLIEQDLRCGKCGCFLEYKKNWLAEHCPINKW